MNRANLFVGFSAILPVENCLFFNYAIIMLGIFMFCFEFSFKFRKTSMCQLFVNNLYKREL